MNRFNSVNPLVIGRLNMLTKPYMQEFLNPVKAWKRSRSINNLKKDLFT
jgi:hypothetical protein